MCRMSPWIAVLGVCCALAAAAEKKSWTMIRYTGGTLPAKPARYDWNTTLTVTANPDSITIAVAPPTVFSSGHTVRIEPGQVVSLSSGAAAWKRVAETPGSTLPRRPPSLFGLFENPQYFAIVWESGGKRHAALLDSLRSSVILQVLNFLTGKAVEFSP